MNRKRVDEMVAVAVRAEKDFWHMVVILAVVFGAIVGATGGRWILDQSPNTALISDAVRVPQLEAEVIALRSWCAPPVLEALCPGDPLGGPCAVSWERILMEPSFDVVFVKCDEGGWWRVDWTQERKP